MLKVFDSKCSEGWIRSFHPLRSRWTNIISRNHSAGRLNKLQAFGVNTGTYGSCRVRRKVQLGDRLNMQ